jgi:hypothetical protein
MKLFTYSVTSLCILFIAARIVPSWLIQNNLEKIVGEDSRAVEYAEELLWMVGHGTCSQLAALTCTGVKITEFKPIVDTSSYRDNSSQTCPYPYEGRIVVYGLFGIPSREVKFGCDASWFTLPAPIPTKVE